MAFHAKFLNTLDVAPQRMKIQRAKIHTCLCLLASRNPSPTLYTPFFLCLSSELFVLLKLLHR